MEKISKDEIAQRLWRRNYDQLSEWGRKKVDHVESAMNPNDQEPIDFQATALQRENLRLTAALENSKMENLDLWEQLAEARAELEEIRASSNLPSS